MGEQVEKIFTWVLKNFSDLQDEPSYSRPFAFAGCNWRCDTKVLEGQRWFDASSSVWGFKEFMPLSTIRYRDNKLLLENLRMLHLKRKEKGSLKEGSLTVGNCGRKCNNVASETEVSNVDYYDDAPIEDPGDDDVIENDQGDDSASSLASGVSDRDVGSLNKFEHASQRADDGDMKCNKVVSVTEASNDFPEEVQPVEETKDVNGFQVESVSHIFRRHPDIALGFRPKNQEIRKAYMNELLSLIKMLCQSQRSSPRMF
ncbi:hypothetical protein Bca52824_037857 [Brassica carinata]|uniref:MATH domain-containing protein n=1 Tax=Brassica carinata TaxID=52824 RepID=A0A8X7RL46_BRACI|nr:hypothetical protein Bca52824_037857 [Brassica carinata]